jgi:hypothetical protein
MNTEAVIQRASAAYGMEDMLAEAYETNKSPGDTLALFLARELQDADDLRTVVQRLDSAIRDLEDVRAAFEYVAEVVQKPNGYYVVELPGGGTFNAPTKQEIREWLSHAKQEAIWSC